MAPRRQLPKRPAKPAEVSEETPAEAAERIVRLVEETPATLDTSTLRKARERFSSLFQQVVESHRPQRISRRGGEAVVVLHEGDFWALMRHAPQEIPMAEYFRAVAPVEDAGLEPLARPAKRDLAEL